jgi:excisionase family DNA binding protein
MTDVGPEALELLTIAEVAPLLRVSVTTIKRLVVEWRRNPGTGLESVKVGSRRLIAPEAIIDYKQRLRSQAQQSDVA